MEIFSHLHCHSDKGSNLRLIDCITSIKDIVDKAVSLGNKGVAITDHESVSAHISAIKYVKAGKEKEKIPKDFKLILGNECYLVDDVLIGEDEKRYCTSPFYHFILLAKDETGHRQLRELSSLAWDNSFKTGKMERVPTIKRELKEIIENDRGHLIASTACLGGELPKLILEMRDLSTKDKKEKQKELDSFLEYCLSLFGDDFYLELQPSEDEEQQYVNSEIVKLSEERNIKTIITTDAHYIEESDRVFHKAYLNSHEEEREVDDFYSTTYMMDGTQIHSYMDENIGKEKVSLSLSNTIEITDKVEEYDLYHPTIVPAADIPEFELSHLFKSGYDRYPYIKSFAYSDDVFDRYLLKLIEDGFNDKVPYEEMTQEEIIECIERIEIELKEMWLVTEKLKTSISSYYLSTLELINIMWDEGDSIVGIARGSVTGMFTMYLIDIIQMNPMKWKLPHWRHISHEKVELSDIDIDTAANRRKQIIEAVKKRKGERYVLNCCTFKTEGSKSAIHTTCRGMDIDVDVSHYIANMIPVTRGFTWTLSDCMYGNAEEDRKPIKEFINEVAKYPNLIETAMKIEGLVCGRSMHASAVYVFNEDFTAHNARMKTPSGEYVTQFSMYDSD